MSEIINLVNIAGERVGEMEKMEAHVKGELHEAFSIFVFNENGELLLQRRAWDKYHSGGLWTNSCCSHARVGEDIEVAVHRRLFEEMGFDCDLMEKFSFVYKTDVLVNDVMEHEFDHVFFGDIDKQIEVVPNPAEVCEYKWMKIGDLIDEVKLNPEKFTEWLQIILHSTEFKKIV